MVASEAELAELSEVAADPYFEELIGALDFDQQADLYGALASFGAGVTSSPRQSYQRLDSALGPLHLGADEATEESDAAIVLEIVDLYRAWSELTLYGTDS